MSDKQTLDLSTASLAMRSAFTHTRKDRSEAGGSRVKVRRLLASSGVHELEDRPFATLDVSHAVQWALLHIHSQQQQQLSSRALAAARAKEARAHLPCPDRDE